MIFVTAQPDLTYLLWQVEVQAYNFYKLGQIKNYKPLVGYVGQPSVYAKELIEKGIDIQLFPDTRTNKVYIPSIRPHLLSKFFTANPEMGAQVFYHDADIIFKMLPDFESLLADNIWYVSNTISYIGYNYVLSKGEAQLKQMADIVGISLDQVKANELNSGGAQYLFKNITSDFFNKVEIQGNELYKAMQLNEPHYQGADKNPIQKWCADMWAILWNAFLVADVRVSKELDFCWATDPLIRWDHTKILHLAGATSNNNGTMFYKGEYINKLPFGVDLTFIEKQNNCSAKYAQLLMEYSRIRNTIKY